MQETLTEQTEAIDATQASMREYLGVAMMQAESLPKILRVLQTGSDLSLSTWREAFESTHRTLEHIKESVTRAEEIFEEHEAEVSGALSEEMTCDEFQCLTWR